LRQFEIGISTNLYLPAIGTAGLLLVDVSGDSLVPAPPPNMIAIIFLFIVYVWFQITENFCIN
jgi:hypothetical protein